LRTAQFVFIAARSGELTPQPGNVDAYGADEGQWKPFLALGENRPVNAIAQEAALRQNLEYDRLPVNGPVRTAIDAAASAIIAIVDPRSVALPQYRNITFCCDRVLNHLAVLVPWVAPDDASDHEVQQIVRNTFPVLSARRDPRSLSTGIRSTREMRKRLRKALTELYDMLLHEEIARRPASSPPPPEVANK
jgi:FxsC-like protein